MHSRLCSRCHQKLPDFRSSHRASRDLKPRVSVKALISRGHVNGDGLFERQLSGVYGTVSYYGFFPFDGVVVLPSILCCR